MIYSLCNIKRFTLQISTTKFSDTITTIYIEVPWGAQVGYPVYFNVTGVGNSNDGGVGHTHYVWNFEEKVIYRNKGNIQK